jgi:hypothetical protein
MKRKLFLKRWQDGLTRRSYLWEGPSASAELVRLCYLRHLRFDNGWQAHDTLRLMLQELRLYRAEAKALDSGMEPSPREFKYALELLETLETKIKNTLKKTWTPEVRSVLLRVMEKIVTNRDSLLATRKALGKSRQSPLGIVEHFYRESPRKRLLHRRVDLDNRLQIQLAKALSFYLPRLSRKTTARLIVLTYWAAGEAAESEQKGYLKILGTGRRLTVRSVHDRLKYARFGRT